MTIDKWPQPPFHPKDYTALLELLGPEEFEQRVCPLDVARERWRHWLEGELRGGGLAGSGEHMHVRPDSLSDHERYQDLPKRIPRPPGWIEIFIMIRE